MNPKLIKFKYLPKAVLKFMEGLITQLEEAHKAMECGGDYCGKPHLCEVCAYKLKHNIPEEY